jgi:hypothetical protein
VVPPGARGKRVLSVARNPTSSRQRKRGFVSRSIGPYRSILLHYGQPSSWMRRRSFFKSLREDNASREDARVQQQPESSSTRHFPRCPPVPLFSKCSLAAWGDVNCFNKFKSSIPCRSCMDRFELNVQATLERFHHYFGPGMRKKAARAFLCPPATRPTRNNADTSRSPLGADYTVD